MEDVIVVGLGHAGVEAALACAKMGLRTLAVTLRRDRIGLMSCNPAVGGTAKGHLVRELDALGGLMGLAADRAGTHFKTLNASRGPAVRATRVLCDRELYASGVRAQVEAQERLEVVEDEVVGLLLEDGRVRGVKLGLGKERQAKAVVLTTGTFLAAVMHVGERQQAGGRQGDAAAVGLSEGLRAAGLQLRRFKTGTPPRLLGRSIDWARCTPQPADPLPRPFSLRTPAGFAFLPQLPCHLTWTCAQTHRVVMENLGRSPLFEGRITGLGPRYCPSLEDKVVRFAARERHQVFLEPEGLQSEWVYPSGLSTSLPQEVQEEMIRTICGLEEAQVVRHGYAVEYDCVLPTQLLPTLEVRRVAGLYLAGQLNGTSGYEEAAFQGLYAGVNAALAVKGEPPLLLRRDEAHGAVLVDELVTRGVDEPFRMLTSRSEHRLLLREGNADLRLRHHGQRVGLVSSAELEQTQARRAAIDAEVGRLKAGPWAGVLRRPSEGWGLLQGRDLAWRPLPPEVAEEVEVEIKYEGYIAQQARASAREADAFEHWRIPDGLRFCEVQGLCGEAVDKLERLRPSTLSQAKRIPGITPAALSLVLIHLRRRGGLAKY